MSGAGAGRTAGLVGAVLLAAVHFLARPLLGSWEMSPDLLAGALLLAALQLRAGTAAAVGFALGLLEAALALADPAPLAALYTVTGYLGVRCWDLLFADVRIFLPTFLVTGSWVLIVVKQWIVVGDLTLYFIGVPAVVAALLTALTAGVWSLISGVDTSRG